MENYQMSIWKENYQLMKELDRMATSYLTFVDCGGHDGDYTDTLINMSISLLTKIKCNRDFINSYMHCPIPTETEECITADSILDGTFVQDRLFNVIDRVYKRSMDA